MLVIYIIGSSRFSVVKEDLYNFLNGIDSVAPLAVGISEIYKNSLNDKNYEELHYLEDRSMDEANFVILVDSDYTDSKVHVGEDTQRELNYCVENNITVLKNDINILKTLLKKG